MTPISALFHQDLKQCVQVHGGVDFAVHLHQHGQFAGSCAPRTSWPFFLVSSPFGAHLACLHEKLPETQKLPHCMTRPRHGKSAKPIEVADRIKKRPPAAALTVKGCFLQIRIWTLLNVESGKAGFKAGGSLESSGADNGHDEPDAERARKSCSL